MKNKTLKSPYLMIILGFLIIILVGSFLLLLPISHNKGHSLSFVDSFFVSTSAICVTGLSPINVNETLSVFGKIVLAVLIEIGGLGFVTIVMFFIMILGKKIDINNRVLIKEALNQEKLSGVVKLVKKIILTTLIIQSVGSIIYFIHFIQEFSFWKAVGVSIFTAISAFNNAGFDLFGVNSLIDYNSNIIINVNTCMLIVFGGIGFIVIFDCLKKRSFRKLTIHSKIVIKTTLALIICGTLLIKFTNWGNIKWYEAIFASITTRTAGFTTIDLASTISTSGLIVMMVLMFIGASPSSTGGGVKTTTFYTIVVSIVSFIKGKKSTISNNRKICQESIFKAYVVALFGFIFIVAIIFFICLVEDSIGSKIDVLDITFESVSAFGTVGLSLGITSILHPISKYILCIAMFFGRLGPITIMSMLHKGISNDAEENVKYIEEKIIIG